MNDRHDSDKWNHAQEEEIQCWIGIAKKLKSEHYINLKKDYWTQLLQRVGISPNELSTDSILEIGNGPSGLFLLAPNNENYVIADPLNDSYKKNFPWLFGSNTIISEKAENLELGKKFSRIFAINCIDHCDNIDDFLVSMRRHLDKDGKCYLAVNTHNYQFICSIWSRWQKVIEPHHPYQMTVDQYNLLMAEYFLVEQIYDIEDLIIDINNKTRSESLNIKTPSVKRKFLEKIDDEIIGKLLIRSLAFLGYPSHDFSNRGRSLFRHKLFVLTNKKSE